MEFIAKLKNLRISPRKTRMVADLIRGQSVPVARHILRFTLKKAAYPIAKLLDSAVANAKNNFHYDDEEKLYIAAIKVDEGRKLKRWRARARGRAGRIEKKTSHITICLKPLTKVIHHIK